MKIEAGSLWTCKTLTGDTVPVYIVTGCDDISVTYHQHGNIEADTTMVRDQFLDTFRHDPVILGSRWIKRLCDDGFSSVWTVVDVWKRTDGLLVTIDSPKSSYREPAMWEAQLLARFRAA